MVTAGTGLRSRDPAGGPATDAGPVWDDLRGAFVADGALFWGSATDGALHRGALDGSRGVRLDPYADPAWKDVLNGSGGTYAGAAPDLAVRDVRAMAYGAGRVYYVLAGDPRLHTRAFSTDSGVLGAVASVADASRDWSRTSGLVLAGDRLLVAEDGDLSALAWRDGRPAGPLEPVSATGDWGGAAMWLVPPA